MPNIAGNSPNPGVVVGVVNGESVLGVIMLEFVVEAGV